MRLKNTVWLMVLFSLLPWFRGVAEEKRVLILGDSLTKGEGLEPQFAFPALLQEKLAEGEFDEWKVLNGGVSGDTTAGGLRRVSWLMRKKVHILVLALGANDGLRGIDPSETDKNLQGIIDKAKRANPDIRILIAGMQMPDNFGQDYITRFRKVFPTVASRNQLPLIPFLLEGVGGNPALNLPDQIHPNKEGQKVLAQTVWKSLRPMILSESGTTPP